LGVYGKAFTSENNGRLLLEEIANVIQAYHMGRNELPSVNVALGDLINNGIIGVSKSSRHGRIQLRESFTAMALETALNAQFKTEDLVSDGFLQRMRNEDASAAGFTFESLAARWLVQITRSQEKRNFLASQATSLDPTQLSDDMARAFVFELEFPLIGPIYHNLKDENCSLQDALSEI
jgi:hypothetical protein